MMVHNFSDIAIVLINLGFWGIEYWDLGELSPGKLRRNDDAE